MSGSGTAGSGVFGGIITSTSRTRVERSEACTALKTSCHSSLRYPLGGESDLLSCENCVGVKNGFIGSKASRHQDKNITCRSL